MLFLFLILLLLVFLPLTFFPQIYLFCRSPPTFPSSSPLPDFDETLKVYVYFYFLQRKVTPLPTMLCYLTSLLTLSHPSLFGADSSNSFLRCPTRYLIQRMLLTYLEETPRVLVSLLWLLILSFHSLTPGIQ